MLSEAHTFYKAMLAKDFRFDGRFFVGVHTTKIYCRPICPAKKPKFENVSFYKTAAAAEESGFRACLRCRPETAPGTPPWIGTSTTVTRALRLLGEGNLGEQGMVSLSSKLGVSDRHLRELFAKHLGASPIHIYQTMRLDVARRLIDQTNLAMTQVAFASGFESLRRFNDAFVKRFRKTPRELRKNQEQKSSGILLNLPYRTPFDVNFIFEFLKSRSICGVEVADGKTYARTIQHESGNGYFTACVDDVKRQLKIEIFLRSTANLMQVIAKIKNIFDLDADSLTIENHLRQDSALSDIVKKNPGLRVPGCWDTFEVAVRAIVGQQVSVKAARTLISRFVEKYGTKIDLEHPELKFVFPNADRLAKDELAVDGIVSKRLKSISCLAKMVVSGELNFADAPEVIREKLLSIPGIGIWTADYIAMRGLKDPDAFLETDLVIKRAAKSRNFDHLSPWRAYANMYLWKKG